MSETKFYLAPGFSVPKDPRHMVRAELISELYKLALNAAGIRRNLQRRIAQAEDLQRRIGWLEAALEEVDS